MDLAYAFAMIKRAYEPLDTHLQPNKVLLIYGPRWVGKTTLLQTFLAHTPRKRITLPKSWLAAYSEAEFFVITPDNYVDFVLPSSSS